MAILSTLLAAILFVEPAPASVGGPELIVRTVEPDALRGRLVQFSFADGLRIQTEAGERRVPTSDLVYLIQPRRPQPRRDVAVTLRLHNDDLLPGRLVGGREGVVQIACDDLGEVPVPIHLLAELRVSQKSERSAADAQASAHSRRAAADDLVRLTNGDSVSGFITLIDAGGITIDTASGEASVPMRLVVSATFASPAVPNPEGLHAVVELLSGARVTIREVEWTDAGLTGKLSHGERVQIEADRIASLAVRGGRWQWLSHRQPTTYEHTPMLAAAFPYRLNQNVRGGPLRVAGETFELGVGTHSRSRLIYDLDASYSEFVTAFGMDDDSGAFANVAIAVLVDGVARFEESDVVPGAMHEPIRVDLRGAKTLELLVDFGANGDLQDRLDWIEPALIR